MSAISLSQIRLIFVISFFTISLGVYAQKDSQDSHLEPVEFKYYTAEGKEYYDNIFSLLHKNFTEKPIIRFTVIPSFGREYALSVEQKRRKYYLASNTLSESYWRAIRSYRKDKVTMTSKQQKIDKSFYELIQQLFEIATSQIRMREVEKQITIIDGEVYTTVPSMKLDGVKYYFSTTNSTGEILIGKAHSPSKNTLMDRLVDICIDLYFLSQGKDISKNELESKMKSLITDMKN